MNVEVSGIAGVTAKLKGLASGYERATQEVIDKYTGIAVKRAKDRAPVDTGALRESIRGELEAMAGYVIAGSGKVDYAIHQEFGTRYQSGTPYLRPTLEEIKEPFFRELAEVIRKV